MRIEIEQPFVTSNVFTKKETPLRNLLLIVAESEHLLQVIFYFLSVRRFLLNTAAMAAMVAEPSSVRESVPTGE